MTYPKRIDDNRWIIEVKGKDGRDEELYLDLPPEALNQMGWAEGDELEWIDQKDGSWMLRKKDDADE